MPAAPPMTASPRLPARELLALAAGTVLLAVLMFWPLVPHLGTDLPKDLGDPLAQAWQLAWGGHALTHQPLRFFQANQFWPLPDTLAFSDALVGYSPLSWIGTGVTAAVVRYDLLFLLASALALAGAYLLARELGATPAGAAVAGVAFAYAPWRLEQGGHLHILSSGGIPLAIFLLVRGYRRGSAGTVVAGWACAAWQVSIGFSLGLPFLLVLAVGAAIALVVWWRAGRPAVPARLVRATVVGVLIVGTVTVALGRPYLRVREAEPQATRSAVTVAHYSDGPKAFLASSSLNPIWGPVSAGVRDDLAAVPEETLFPGLVVLVIAGLGATWRGWPRWLRAGLLAAAAAFAVLSLGFETHGIGRFLPYRALYEVVPGWSGIRVPGRLTTFTSLALALLAAAGATRIALALAASGRPRAGTAAVAGLCVLVLAEGAGFGPGRWYPHPTAPPAPAGQAGLPAPLLHLPAGPDDNRRYLLWSADGLAPMINGRSSLAPRFTTALLAGVTGFPDAASVRRLRAVGVRTVVLHPDRLAGTPWASWRARPITGLGLTRTVRGGVVVYRLR